MAGVVLLSRSIRPRESMHGHARTFSEQLIASITHDSRCGMSDVAFRSAPPIGGLFCLKAHPNIKSKHWPKYIIVCQQDSWLESPGLQTHWDRPTDLLGPKLSKILKQEAHNSLGTVFVAKSSSNAAKRSRKERSAQVMHKIIGFKGEAYATYNIHCQSNSILYGIYSHARV